MNKDEGDECVVCVELQCNIPLQHQASHFSVAKSNPNAETNAARPPIRRATAPAATTKAVMATADFESEDIGLPVSGSSSGTYPAVVVERVKDRGYQYT